MKFDSRKYSSPREVIAGVSKQPGFPNAGGDCSAAGTAAEQSGNNPSLSVCHLSPVHGRLDTRTYNLQILPALRHGVRATLLAPYSSEQSGAPELLPASGRRNRLLRF